MRDRIWAASAPGKSSSIARRWVGSLALLLAALVSLLAAPLASAVLPDGRVYEIVSPVKKNGNAAGSIGYGAVHYGISSPSGDRMLYGVTGPVEGGTRGIQILAVGNRGADGWHSFDPMAYPAGQVNYVNYIPAALQVSTDLNRFAFNINGGDLVPGNPSSPPLPNTADERSGAIYVTEPGKSISWVTKPTTSTPLPAVGETSWLYMVPAGQSPDLSTYYFSYIGTLTPEDASRAPNVNTEPAGFQKTPRGFYRWSNGSLVSYGSLPDGSFDPFGAVPAGGVPDLYGNNSMTPGTFNGQVSGDGQQVVFVSPDPTSGSGRTAQLYVRRGDAPSVLVSRSEVTGLPSASGPFKIDPPRPSSGSVNFSYAYGSLDGSHVYFESTDALTSDAPVSAVEKAYMFDVASKDLHYLAGVRGEPIAAAPDLSKFIYGREAGFGANNKSRVGIWDGSTATDFAESSAKKKVLNGRSTTDGKVFVFETNQAIPGFNNGAGSWEQVYRYDVPSAELSCISCPPDAVTPESNGELSHSQTNEPQVPADGKLVDARGISADGQRVFFDTGDPLVKQDANGVRDVYMWENGKVSLISSGRSADESYFIDNSESGDDVFFTTSEGLIYDDTDGAYDIYDARVGGGFSLVGPPAPCSSGCQTPAASPSFHDAGSTEFNGAGNAKHRHRKSKCAKGKVRKQGKCVKKHQKSHKRTANTKQGSGK